MTTMSVPTSAVDPFAPETLADPHPVWRALREAGPAVRLTSHPAWVIPRYAEQRAALIDHATFSSAEGVGLDPVLNENTRGTVIASDPPAHTRLRTVLASQLLPRAMRALTDDILARGDALVAACVERGSFDAAADLAYPFPVDVVADLLGLPEEGRDALVGNADAAFVGFGPRDERAAAAMPAVGAMFGYLGSAMAPDRVRPDGWAAQVWAAAERGEIDHASVVPLLSAYLVAGMDTTIHGIGNTIDLLARDPDAFAGLRADPSLAGPAFEESLRVESPVTAFFRTTTREVDVDGVTIPAGEKVLLPFASANRDERRWADPDRFDVKRRPTGHLAFGAGIHNCAGQFLARVEAEAILGALVRRCSSITPAGPAERALGPVIRGMRALPITVREV
ncbi:cytochrome P450 [Actinomycetospora endophytica]|uniref:Cytochrome P450 n=1 Tax=Actinomycetospora endophytica TaxID=2291215 RepID=A0ABS8P0W8_9PSEU|nr:cytochrome P450 [Actinomycetospora endophytica]MCD2191890.1 cytochrome P450 [Actinomycetospora endophytica]